MPPIPPPRPRTVAYGLLLLTLLVIAGWSTVFPPSRPTPEETPQPQPEPQTHIPDTRPICYEIYKFCVGLEDLKDEIVDHDGLPVDDTYDEKTWRMVTVILLVTLKDGEGKGMMSSSSVSLIDTEGVMHTNDNRRVGFNGTVFFDRQNRSPGALISVFLLDEEEIDCVLVTTSKSPDEVCLSAGAA